MKKCRHKKTIYLWWVETTMCVSCERLNLGDGWLDSKKSKIKRKQIIQILDAQLVDVFTF